MITDDIVGNSRGLGNGTGATSRTNPGLLRRAFRRPETESPQARARLRSVGGENDGASRQLARFVKEAAANYLPAFEAKPVFRGDRYLRGGDHMPFAERGYPAVRFTEPSENFARQHQDVRAADGVEFGDVVAKVDMDYVATVTRVNAAVLATLALAPPAPSGATIETKKVENDTTLRWEPGDVPDLAGFEVLWRDTTSPFWEHSLYVGNVHRVTLPDLSKDDLHFGVRAVDRAGHRGLVSFPLPAVRTPEPPK